MRHNKAVKLLKYICLFCALLGVLMILNVPIRTAFANWLIGEPHRHTQYAGVLNLPNIGLSLPCIDVSVENEALSQRIIDHSNCGARIHIPHPVVINDEQREIWLIGDHDYQGFIKIVDCKLGDPVFFQNADGTELQYVVVNSFEGFIGEDGHPLDKDGIGFLSCAPQNLFLMTCFPEADVPAPRDQRRFFVCLKLISE